MRLTFARRNSGESREIIIFKMIQNIRINKNYEIWNIQIERYEIPFLTLLIRRYNHRVFNKS